MAMTINDREIIWTANEATDKLHTMRGYGGADVDQLNWEGKHLAGKIERVEATEWGPHDNHLNLIEVYGYIGDDFINLATILITSEQQ